MKPDIKTAKKIVDLLNSLIECDKNAVASLVANRVPCNSILADHPTVQVGTMNGGYSVGLLGILNGICGIKENGYGLIVAHFEDDPEADFGKSLTKFVVDENIPTPATTTRKRPQD